MLTRRVLLKSGGLALFSLGVEPRFIDRLALSATELGKPKVLVTIFLRGAMDGLMAVPLLNEESNLKGLRPRLAMSAAASSAAPVLDLEGRFGLHPAFAPLLPLWQDGRMAIVHAVGSPNPTRSHFDAQDFMETGTPWRKGTSSGWLNRVRQQLGGTSPFTAISLTPDLPKSLYGVEPALAIPNLAEFKLARQGNVKTSAKIHDHLEMLYKKGSGGSLKQRASEMFETTRILSQPELKAYWAKNGKEYPSSTLGHSLLQIAYLIKTGVGLRIACAESPGWDTHVNQGAGEGAFALLAADLGQSISAFWNDIEAFHDDVVVLTMTEFGRTVRENGSGGTDHGHGSCLFVLGNQVDGGKVYGDLTSLEPESLFEGRDLPVTTDFRAVFAEVTGKLFNVAEDSTIFPGWKGTKLPLMW